jgi:hypothetical protein
MIVLIGLVVLMAAVVARRGLERSRRETAAVSQDRDNLIGQRETARAYTASTLGNGDAPARGDRLPDGNGHRGGSRGRWHLFGRLSGSRRLRAEGRAGQAKGNIEQAGAKIGDASGH